MNDEEVVYTAVRRLRSSFHSRLCYKSIFSGAGQGLSVLVSLAWSQMDLDINETKTTYQKLTPEFTNDAQRAPKKRGLMDFWVWNCRGDLGVFSLFSSLRSSQLLLWNSIQTTLCLLYQDNSFIHGHRTLKAPHPVRSAQLTRVPPS